MNPLQASTLSLAQAGCSGPRPQGNLGLCFRHPDLTRQPNFAQAHHRWLAIGRLEPGHVMFDIGTRITKSLYWTKLWPIGNQVLL